MRYHVAALILALSFAFGFQACGDSEPPVARVTVSPTEVRLDYASFASLNLDWEMLAPLDGATSRPFVFIHLLDGSGRVVRTFDHLLPVDWRPDSRHEYSIKLYLSALAPPLDEEPYALTLGLYDGKSLRWPLAIDGPQVARQEYRVAEVAVRSESATVPSFFFSPAWLPIETTDYQTLALRWLTKAGAIRLAEIPGPGTAWLSIRLPIATQGIDRLVMDDNAAQQAVTVRSACGDLEAILTGPGLHQVEVPVTADADGNVPEECEIALEPNFHLEGEEDQSRRALQLEILTWASGR